MTRDDILRMAREAGLMPLLDEDCFQTLGVKNFERTKRVLERFAALVAAAKDAEHQQTLALQQRSYEREIQLEVEAERERIIQFLQEMQRQVGDAHNHYGVAAVRIKEGV